MSQGCKSRLNYRRPACFAQEIDVDMFYEPENDECYCLRCPFFGSEEEMLKLNEMAKFRYKNIMKHITNFDE